MAEVRSRRDGKGFSMTAGAKVPRNKPYRARVRIGGDTIYLGYYATPEEAMAAREQRLVEEERYKEWCETHGLPY